MTAHGATCPCCRPGLTPGVLETVVDSVLAALVGVVLVAGRFVSGRVLCRARGRWDASWRGWAPVPHPMVPVRAGERVPCSAWGRRPGWQRQVVRLAAVVLVLAASTSPLLTGAGVAGALLGVAATVLFRRLDWSPPQGVKAAAPGDPMRELPVLRRDEPPAWVIDQDAQPVR